MRLTRNYRWPLGFWPTMGLYVAAATALMYYGIHAFFWLIVFAAAHCPAAWGCVP